MAAGKTSEAGVALLPDLPAGEPLVVAAHPAGRRLSTSTRVELLPGEHRLIDLLLPSPANLEIEPRLAEDLLRRAKSAVITSLSISKRTSGQPSESRRELLNGRRVLVFEDLHPGYWQINVIVEIGGFPYPIELEGIDLAPGENRRISPRIEPLLFTGRVTLANQGIDASIGFKSRDVPSGIGIGRHVRSAPDGAFSILLPRAGRYLVDVTRAEALDQTILLGVMDITDPSQPLRVVVPEGRVTVIVWSQHGPVAGVTVSGLPSREDLRLVPTSRAHRVTGDDGKAYFTMLSKGEWTFQVEDESGKVVTKTIRVEEGVALEVDLTL